MAAAVELSDKFTGSVGSSLRLPSGASVVEIGAGSRHASSRPASGPVMAGGGGALTLGALTRGGLAAVAPCVGDRAAGKLELAAFVAIGNEVCDPMPIGEPGAPADLLGGGATGATEGIAR